ncbi:MAG: response regulator [Desulfobacteraceae bacterium]|nr:MAG: response regulator [Desulfobacteraceae bacterium]
MDSECVHRITEKSGHQIETVANGKELLATDKPKTFDLVFLNLFLQDMKGYELIPEIKKFWPESRIITVTEYNSRELEAKVRKERVIYYMLKPIDNEYL